jgi:hypothetical protein
LKGFLDELSSFDEEKVFEVVDGLSVFGVVHDGIAVVEESFEFGVEEIVNGGGLRLGHRAVR